MPSSRSRVNRTTHEGRGNEESIGTGASDHVVAEDDRTRVYRQLREHVDQQSVDSAGRDAGLLLARPSLRACPWSPHARLRDWTHAPRSLRHLGPRIWRHSRRRFADHLDALHQHADEKRIRVEAARFDPAA